MRGGRRDPEGTQGIILAHALCRASEPFFLGLDAPREHQGPIGDEVGVGLYRTYVVMECVSKNSTEMKKRLLKMVPSQILAKLGPFDFCDFF